MTVQYIEKNGHREYAIIPIDEYERLVTMAEMADDIIAYDHAKTKTQAEADDTVPSQVVNRLLDGENPIRVWREFRGLTQQQLAERIDLTKAELQQLETNMQELRVQTLSRIANALEIIADDIACWHTGH